MAKMEVRVSRAAIRDMLTSDSVRADIARRAEAVADACNAESSWGGYKATHGGRSRARSSVWTVEPEAVADNARNNRIVRNLDAGL